MKKTLISFTVLLLLSSTALLSTSTISAYAVTSATFTRDSNAYQLNGVQVLSNTPRYENGGILLEEATANLIGAASDVEGAFPGNLGCWANPGSASLTQDTTQHWQGTASSKLTSTYNGTQTMAIYAGYLPVTAGATYAFSVHAKTSQAKTAYLAFEWYNSSGSPFSTTYSKTYTINQSEWTRLINIGTAPAGAAGCLCHLIVDDVNYNTALWWDGAQLEQSFYASSWQISGTSRNKEYLTIPTAGILNASQGTLELKVYIDPDNVHSAQQPQWTMPFSTVDAQGSQEKNQISIRRFPYTTSWVVVFSNNAGLVNHIYLGDITTPGWYGIAATWQSGVGGYGYLNGVQKGSMTANYMPSAITAPIANIGDWLGGNSFGSVISDLRISNRARSSTEIQTAYQSGKALPLDANTTLKLPLNGSLNGTENAIIYNYDQANRLNGVNAPQSSASYQYDNNGNLLRRQ